MKFFQNFAPEFLEKECETTTNARECTYRWIGLSPSRWHRARMHRVWDNAIHLTASILHHSEFVISQTIPSRSPQNISPGDPAAAGPLDSPQSKSWMTTGMVPSDNN